MRNTELAIGEYYHVFNRGVDRQTLFHNDGDFERFLLLLHFCNQEDRLSRDILRTTPSVVLKEKRLVAICSYVIMPNHFHMKLKQVKENGIQRFLQRFQMAYAKYFNTLHERRGTLFESAYRCVHICRESQWFHLTNYIHLNPLDLSGILWREGVSKEWPKAKTFLDVYSWSSYHAFRGQLERVPILDEQYLKERAPDPLEYLKEMEEWVGRMALTFDIPGGSFDE
ncbi:transposase [Candidatus Uhrbacteria bacterium]|nr:transposase [Candidatus Uhrbacteria bacterium]